MKENETKFNPMRYLRSIGFEEFNINKNSIEGGIAFIKKDKYKIVFHYLVGATKKDDWGYFTMQDYTDYKSSKYCDQKKIVHSDNEILNKYNELLMQLYTELSQKLEKYIVVAPTFFKLSNHIKTQSDFKTLDDWESEFKKLGWI